MTKDYAKKRRLHAPVKSRGHYASASAALIMPTWAWMVAGLTLGLTLAAMLYWKLNAKHALPQKITIAVEEIDGSGSTHKQRISAESQAQKSNRFDFYTVLPNMTMDVPDSNKQPSTVDLATKSEPHLTTASPELLAEVTKEIIPVTQPTPDQAEPQFIVQVGAFRTLQQAEELKAQLALSGLQASVQTFEKAPNNTWHRVYVGPFTDKPQALAQQQRLQQTQALHGLVLKMRV